MENPTNMDDLGVPPFQETSILYSHSHEKHEIWQDGARWRYHERCNMRHCMKYDTSHLTQAFAVL